MKILFLDIDGVLNGAFVLDKQRRGDAIDRGMVERINQIVDATGCKIVISSTWRLYHKPDKLSALLYGYGLRQVIIDRTPELDIENFNRGDEINIWLVAHPEVTHFVILDDNDDPSMRNLVKTTFNHGLQDEHVVKAITLLNENKMFTRVEVEFLSGPEDTRDRRTFEKVKILEFVQDSHLRIVSVDDGELIVKWNRLGWYHTQPQDKLGVSLSIDEQILDAMADANGAHSNYLNGIRKRRELTNEGLKEAKEYVERLRAKHGL